MEKLIFNKNFGKFREGETHEVKSITADYFVNNGFATKVVDKKEDCGCNDAAKEIEVEEKPKKGNNKK